MTHRVAFLITPAEFHNDNHERLPGLFRDAGWTVDIASHEDACWQDRQVLVGSRPANDYDLVWPVGFGPRVGSIDRIQLLAQMDQSRLITAASAYLTLHGKTAWLEYAPDTMVAQRSARLIEYLQTYGGDWVLKPVAGSFGRHVHRVSSAAHIEQVMAVATDGYWMLQRYIPEITDGEIRTLICHGAIIGSYRRMPTNDLHANLAADASALPAVLSDADADLVHRVHATLMQRQVGFAAIDTVGGYLMEVNLANPGGLGTLSQFHGTLPEQRLLDAIHSHLAAPVRT
jgi:hypothetical protein